MPADHSGFFAEIIVKENIAGLMLETAPGNTAYCLLSSVTAWSIRTQVNVSVPLLTTISSIAL